MEHVEAAGVHSGDSACVLPPQGAGPGLVAELEEQTAALARALGAVGLLNVQFAVRDDRVYVIEANPRASRTVPFVAKATGVPLVRHAVRLMLGAVLDDLGLPVAAPGAPRRGQGGGAPVRAVPRRRPGARPGDAGDRRGDGPRRQLPRGVRQGAARSRAGAAALGRRVHLGARRRQAAGGRAGRAAGARRPRPGRDLRHGGRPRGGRPDGAVGAQDLRGLAPRRRPDRRRGRSRWSSTRPRGGHGARTDGYEIRAAAIRAGIPCITTIEAAEAAAAAVGAPAPARPRALQDAPGSLPGARAFRPGAPHSFRLNLRGRFWSRNIRHFACNMREKQVKMAAKSALSMS